MINKFLNWCVRRITYHDSTRKNLTECLLYLFRTSERPIYDQDYFCDYDIDAIYAAFRKVLLTDPHFRNKIWNLSKEEKEPGMVTIKIRGYPISEND